MSLEKYYADLVIIGSGPAGQKAAMQAAKLGKSVIVIDKDPHPGGASLNSGTIPSKSLRAAILDLTDFYERSFYGKIKPKEEVSINDLNFRLNRVLEMQRELLMRQFNRNQIRLLGGTAYFINEHQLGVSDAAGNMKYEVSGDKIIIAVGSKPRNPKNIPFDKERVLDSTRLLEIDHLPETMLVLGGGVIGSEYASFFAALGTKVMVADKRERILPYLDREISMHLQNALTGIGLQFLAGKELNTIEKKQDEVEVTFQDGTSAKAEMVLYALGRVANVDHLQVKKVGLAVNSYGYIPVNGQFQTELPHIYAVGDVIGAPCLASTSMEQGRLAALSAFGGKARDFPTFFPIGIYTIPEISSCGATEEELKKKGVRYEVGRAYYYEIARNQIVGNDIGMFKILFSSDTLEILGIHIIGREATEVIHIGQVAMTFHARIDYFIDQIFNYPTYAEGYRIAALNGYNKIGRKGKDGDL